MQNILKRNAIALLLALPLISCGNADVGLPNDAQAASEQARENVAPQGQEQAAPVDSSASAGSGDVVLLIAGARDGKGAAGVTSCEIDFQVRNGLSEPIKFVAAFWRPVVVDGIVTSQSAVDARGDQRLYGGKVAPGETKSRKGKVTGVACEQVTGLRLWDITCGLESRADCKDRVSVDNQSQLTLSP